MEYWFFAFDSPMIKNAYLDARIDSFPTNLVQNKIDLMVLQNNIFFCYYVNTPSILHLLLPFEMHEIKILYSFSDK